MYEADDMAYLESLKGKQLISHVLIRYLLLNVWTMLESCPEDVWGGHVFIKGNKHNPLQRMLHHLSSKEYVTV